MTSLLVQPATEIFLSAVVAWELATKDRLGKWPGADVALRDLDETVIAAGLHTLPITLAHARRAGSIRSIHKDPFDRMLAAQGALEGIPVVTLDPAFRSLGCEVLW